MADLPSLERSRGKARLGATGPALLGLAAVLFVVTRIVIWLPLGFVGSFINGVLWPVIVLGVLFGGLLTWRKMARTR